jgi:hypothetical protein
MLNQKFIYKPSGRLCQVIDVKHHIEPDFEFKTLVLQGLTTKAVVELSVEEVLRRVRHGQLIPIKNDFVLKWVPKFSFETVPWGLVL